MNASTQRTEYRSVFISDTHMGTRGARIDFLADFLRQVSCKNLFLVGDIVDGWQLRRSWYWDSAHEEVLRLVLRHARTGTAVTYVPGNHDEMLRNWLPMELKVAGIHLASEAEHTTAAGLRLLITHGDEFDNVVRYGRLLGHVGDGAYEVALMLNRICNLVRRQCGYPYWSLSQWLKRQVKGAVNAVERFEAAVAEHAASRGFDGVVCGHIHHAQMRQIDGVLYLNDGDWVESCTALVEHHDGRMELIEWGQRSPLSTPMRAEGFAA